MDLVEWRAVPGMPYSVSSEGDVRRDDGGRGAVAGRVLSPWVSGNGYVYVELWKDGERFHWLLHQLVATVWHGPPPSPSHEVDHVDRNPLNNHPSNLEWVTHQENCTRYWDWKSRQEASGMDPWDFALAEMDAETEIESPATEPHEAGLPF